MHQSKSDGKPQEDMGEYLAPRKSTEQAESKREKHP